MIWNETNYIKHLKFLIEKRISWKSSIDWKQRDYLNLIELIENETGIILSLSTIKRIWNPNYEGVPHPSTLEAFVKFLGYKNWSDFRAKNQNIFADSKNEIKRNGFKNLKSYKKIFLILFFIILFGIILIVVLQLNNNTSDEIMYRADEVGFSCINSVSKGVPNTVIFNYDASKVKADSLFIQMTWDKTHRDRIQKNSTTLTRVYYYPGMHKAKLIANDSIIKEVDVLIETDKWLAIAKQNTNEGVPTYFKNNDLLKDGKLNVSIDQLTAENVEISKDLMVGYYYVYDFKEISSSEFSFESRLKCDSIINTPCPGITISILGEKSVNIIPLTTGGCIGNARVKMGNVVNNGKNNDLSAFGVDVYQWQSLKVQVRKKQAKVYISNEVVYETNFSEDIGNIVGFIISFAGTGSIDYVSLSYNKEVIYRTDFD